MSCFLSCWEWQDTWAVDRSAAGRSVPDHHSIAILGIFPFGFSLQEVNIVKPEYKSSVIILKNLKESPFIKLKNILR